MTQYRKPAESVRYRGPGAVLPLGSEYRSTDLAGGTEYRASTGQYRVPAALHTGSIEDAKLLLRRSQERCRCAMHGGSGRIDFRGPSGLVEDRLTENQLRCGIGHREFVHRFGTNERQVRESIGQVAGLYLEVCTALWHSRNPLHSSLVRAISVCALLANPLAVLVLVGSGTGNEASHDRQQSRAERTDQERHDRINGGRGTGRTGGNSGDGNHAAEGSGRGARRTLQATTSADLQNPARASASASKARRAQQRRNLRAELDEQARMGAARGRLAVTAWQLARVHAAARRAEGGTK